MRATTGAPLVAAIFAEQEVEPEYEANVGRVWPSACECSRTLLFLSHKTIPRVSALLAIEDHVASKVAVTGRASACVA